MHLEQGSSARYSSAAQVIPWKAMAERIGTLLEEERFASRMEIMGAWLHERKELAQSLLHR